MQINKNKQNADQVKEENALERGGRTLHLPDFQRRHFISTFYQMPPQFLQLLFKLRIHGPEERTTDRERVHVSE